MVEFLNYTVNDLYEEVVERAKEQGVTTEEQWNDIVEAILAERADWGEVDIDDDVVGMRDALNLRWKEFEEKTQGGGVSEE